jgi:tetratricopeptide (TPR) repeat protein
VAAPAAAQSGMIKGKVVDQKKQPVEGATVSIESVEGGGRKPFVVKSNKKGEFIQIGLSGAYKVTAEKEGLGAQTLEAKVRIGSTFEMEFVLGGAGSGPSKEDIAKLEKVKTTFTEGVAASKAGQYDEAIAKFTEASTLTPGCYDCFYNIGFAHSQKKEYDKAEAAFKQAIAMKADYGEAYNALANIYNTQKKFKEAAEASAQAAKLMGGAAGATPGGNAEALYNQGVIMWNAGQAAEAKAKFEETIKAKPDHADAHYWLGMANLNQGKLPEASEMFDKYLKLAPDGQYAAQAKTIIAQLPKKSV